MSDSKPVLLAIYGEGGHRAEMKALLERLSERCDAFQLVSYGADALNIPLLAHYSAGDIRSKYNRWHNLLLTFPRILIQSVFVINILRRHQITGAVSTGPGLALMPMLLCRLFGIKTVFVETSCRFNTRSMTGRLMYRLVNRFLVQNKSLLQLYPDAEYCGRL